MVPLARNDGSSVAVGKVGVVATFWSKRIVPAPPPLLLTVPKLCPVEALEMTNVPPPVSNVSDADVLPLPLVLTTCPLRMTTGFPAFGNTPGGISVTGSVDHVVVPTPVTTSQFPLRTL
jgi:hypothetical protein